MSSITSRLQLSAIARAGCVESAQRDGDENTLWQSAWSLSASINSRLAELSSLPDPALLDIDMHDLWHRYWHGAIHTAPDSPKLHRLVFGIIEAREQGTFTASSVGPQSIPATQEKEEDDRRRQQLERHHDKLQATTSDGSRIWTDVPLLVADMTSHWAGDCATMSSAQRLSGAQFLALLAAAGAAPDDVLCGIALMVLRDALETPRPLGRVGATMDRDPGRQMQDLSIADLLPAANAWLFAAGRKIVLLSDAAAAREDLFPEHVGGLGPLLVDAGEGGDADSTSGRAMQRGFSPQRWMWWLRRLDEIASMASQGGEDTASLALLVHGMMDNMMLIAQQTNGPVRKALQQPDSPVSRRPPVRLFGRGRPAPAESPH
ncbi:hypothetical protein NEMBOFW57_009593 [Staphylotrichum longicolle]|uniref:Uncharacterized protein n=1 Tax=Staphylotrichum longicolle TaxID=669026 RepID=A0AAD4EPQ5_9PEZI|nr:hypothetical protein NEMBOFW57_009593 [Staphylotrichum longicolle]